MNIQNKLFFILFGLSVALIAALMMLVQSSINKGMQEYVNNKEIERLQPAISELTTIYQKEGSWASMDGKHNRFLHIIESVQEDNTPPPRREKQPRRASPPPNADASRMPPPKHRQPPRRPHFALLDLNGELVAGKNIFADEFIEIPITLNNKTIGFLLTAKYDRLTEGYEFDFIKQQKQFLWVIALIAIFFVATVTIALSRHLVIPVKLIANGIHKLTLGEYDQSIHLKRKDELGDLSKDYNELAMTLCESEKSRKRWLANISHELRTPVSIIRGELEAMLDNIRPLTKNNISSANDEVIHLQRLIEDLHLLTTADVGAVRYQKSSLSLNNLLSDESEKFAGYLANAGISLTTAFCPQQLIINADKTRLNQLLENIVNNAIKYSKASQLKISLNLTVHDRIDRAIIIIEDDGVGVEDRHLKHLFDYLYRVDDARNRKDGGTGLGLSICRQIVDAHHGSISANHSTMGGLAVEIILPITHND
ncbi:ATP-binding protein [Shewanella holmiensis]|uniref:histidine kinase n=1 Tax=Shewanella holmiensis TaxID=2952222 RepID=A0A9X2WK36_9GAMM|nr:ATP-binding protein [Shewanella holmiensis]MCT7940362.1 ATP-binding protein [Shewanella holmiensis]